LVWNKTPVGQALLNAEATMTKLEFLGMNFTCVLESLQRYELPSSHGCLFPLLSKILGYGIVAGASIVKLPQIILILKNKSIKGLNVLSFELEVVGFTIALAYALWKQLPFSAYGELVFLLLQGIIQLSLIYYYAENLGLSTWVKTAAYCALAPQVLAGNVNETLFEALYASQHAVFIFARVPQIYENYKTKSTGQLSFLTSFLTFAGGSVRLLTLIQEGAPGMMLLGCFLGFILNGAVMSQIVYYSTKGSPKKDKAKAS
jgi:mannose-P-dolichol utilization defect protein 1